MRLAHFVGPLVAYDERRSVPGWWSALTTMACCTVGEFLARGTVLESFICKLTTTPPNNKRPRTIATVIIFFLDFIESV